MSWLQDVVRARELVGREFNVVTHGGVAHMDDLLAAALLYSRAQAVYRLNRYEEVTAVGGDVLLVDFGDSFKDKLPGRYVVLDHHGVADPAEEPSSIVQVVLALDVRAGPLVATLTHFVDLFDRFGPSVKKWAGPYGSSLNYGLTRVFTGFSGAVRDRFMELVAEAYYAKHDVEALTNAFRVVERLPYVHLAESFPRTFTLLRLMLQAVKNPAVALGREAVEAGFGVDFGCYAVLAVPELEPYVLQGLEQYFSDARHATEVAAAGRFAVIKKDVTAVATEESISPTLFWNALQDLGVVEGPAFVVVKDVRTPGAYVVWRPDRYSNILDFRKLRGEKVVFKHAGGFLAVLKKESAEEAAQYVMRQLVDGAAAGI